MEALTVQAHAAGGGAGLPQRSMVPFWSQPSPTALRRDFDFRAPLVPPLVSQ